MKLIKNRETLPTHLSPPPHHECLQKHQFATLLPIKLCTIIGHGTVENYQNHFFAAASEESKHQLFNYLE
jgi:hypothetical protein